MHVRGNPSSNEVRVLKLGEGEANLSIRSCVIHEREEKCGIKAKRSKEWYQKDIGRFLPTEVLRISAIFQLFNVRCVKLYYRWCRSHCSVVVLSCYNID